MPQHERLDPELMLEKAAATKNPKLRAKYAMQGLASSQIAADLRVLLLRQLYLAQFASGRYSCALRSAELMTELGELSDVAHQDAARACSALGDLKAACGHLRSAARLAPPSRRGFHLWSLGCQHYLEKNYADAENAFRRALRWETRQPELCRAQLALALWAQSKAADLAQEYRRLARANAPGYSELVLGELAFHLGDFRAALELLDRFCDRIAAQHVVKRIGLRAELRHAGSLAAEVRRRHTATETV